MIDYGSGAEKGEGKREKGASVSNVVSQAIRLGIVPKGRAQLEARKVRGKARMIHG